jgi:hypothetical protein
MMLIVRKRYGFDLILNNGQDLLNYSHIIGFEIIFVTRRDLKFRCQIKVKTKTISYRTPDRH